jgi:hypothetical protein
MLMLRFGSRKEWTSPTRRKRRKKSISPHRDEGNTATVLVPVLLPFCTGSKITLHCRILGWEKITIWIISSRLVRNLLQKKQCRIWSGFAALVSLSFSCGTVRIRDATGSRSLILDPTLKERFKIKPTCTYCCVRFQEQVFWRSCNKISKKHVSDP